MLQDKIDHIKSLNFTDFKIYRSKGKKGNLAFYEGSEEMRLLYQLAVFITQEGCRKGFDEAITDFYLRRDQRTYRNINHIQAGLLRELTDGKDKNIAPGLCSPRVEIIREILIFKAKQL